MWECILIIDLQKNFSAHVIKKQGRVLETQTVAPYDVVQCWSVN